jgi:hypothetical protein
MISSIATIAAAFLLQASGTWVIGEEQEVDQGTFMTWQSEQDGWRVWRIETRDGVECRAAKSASGLAPATPLGFGDALDGPPPRTEISAFVMSDYLHMNPTAPQLSQDWYGTHGFGTTQYRAPGERFFESINTLKAKRTGLSLIEINNVSYEYPSIFRGRSELNATFDLTGIEWAEAQVLACYQLRRRR